MICAVTLLPLIILLILTVGGTVVSLTTYIYVENVEFVEDNIILHKTSDNAVEKALKVNIYPMKASNKELVYWSLDESVAEVTSDGVVVGKNFGETTIYAQSKENETKKAVCKIFVTDTKIHTITITNPKSQLVLNESYRLITSYTPQEAVNTRITFSSSAPDIIAVSPDGELKANSNVSGEALITISSDENPNVKAELLVKCVIPVTGVTISDATPIMIGGNTAQFPEYTIYPDNASNKDVKFDSSDNRIATVDQNGKITFLRAGEIEVTLITVDNGFTVSKKFTSTGGMPSSILWSNQSLTFNYQPNALLDINLIFTPSDADLNNVSYSLSKEGVVKVVGGKIYVIGGGNVTVTATSQTFDGNKLVALTNISIIRKVDDIKFFNSTNLETNYIVTSLKNYKLNYSVLPSDYTNKIISFETDNQNVATVQNGIVFFNPNINYGCVNVILKAENGSVVKKVKLVYLDESIKKVVVGKDEQIVNIIMPNSTKEQKVQFALVVDKANVTDVEFIKLSGNATQENDILFFVSDVGESAIKVKINGIETSSVVKVDCKRLVEKFDCVAEGAWGNEKHPIEILNNKIYTSAKYINFNVTLFPNKVSLSGATLSIPTNAVATMQGNVLTFNRAGSVSVTITADSITETILVESTCGLLDDKTEAVDTLIKDMSSSLNINDFIQLVSPIYADMTNISFVSSNPDVLSVDAENKFLIKSGGNVVVTINILAVDKTIKKYTNVIINEEPKSIVLQDNWLYAQHGKFSLNSSLFNFAPSTANCNTDVSYELLGSANNCATIVNNEVIFNKIGIANIKIATAKNIFKVVTVVNAADTRIINLDSLNVVEIEVNVPFAILPNKEVRLNYDYKMPNGLLNITSNGDATFVVNSAVANSAVDKNASITFANVVFNFKGISLAKNIDIERPASNIADFDLQNNTFVTGLNEIKLTAVVSSETTYREIVFSVSDNNIADIDAAGNLKFKRAGLVEVFVAYVKQSDIKKSIKIRSTLGMIETVDIENIVFEFDNLASAKNVINNLSEKALVYPSQLSLNTTNTKLISSNTKVANVSGLNLNILSAGNSNINILCQLASGQFSQLSTFVLQVNRNAEGIKLLNVDIETIKKAQNINSGIHYFNASYFPEDANLNTNIAMEIISGNTFAMISEDNRFLKFNAQNQNIVVKFTLGNQPSAKTWQVTYNCTMLTELINIDAETVIIPSLNSVTFVSRSLGELSAWDITSTGVALTSSINDGNRSFSAAHGGKGSLILKKGETIMNKVLIVTENPSKIDDKKILDKNVNNEITTYMFNDGGHYLTASTEVTLMSSILSTATNKLGNKPTIVYSVDDVSVSTINPSTGVLTFKKAGIANVTLTISDDGYYGAYIVSEIVAIESTFGNVIDFELANPYPSGIYIDTVNTFNVKNGVKVLSPLNGQLKPNYQFSATSNCTIDINGNVTILKTGLAKLNVSTTSQNGQVVERSISINVKKYIDVIQCVDGAKPIIQKIEKGNSYQINCILSSKTSIMPTDCELTYKILSGNATISQSGLVTFGAENTICQVLVEAKYGLADNLAKSTLQLQKVQSDVNIVKINGSTSKVVINKNVNTVLDFDFDNIICSVDLSTNSAIEYVNNAFGIFKGKFGSSSMVDVVSSNKVVSSFELVVTENVESVSLNSNITDGYLTAKGSSAAPINLSELLTPVVYPATARNSDGAYSIIFSVTNVIGEAQIINNILTFQKAGVVKVSVTVGGKVVERTLESTMGYAKDFTWLNNTYSYEFYDGSYTLKQGIDYNISPIDATLQNLKFESQDLKIIAVDASRLVFKAGGNTQIKATYNTSSLNTATKSIKMFVNKSAKEISITDDGKKLNYIVTNNDFMLTYILGIDDVNLSNYNITYVSLNDAIATISNAGKLTFKVDGIVDVVVTVVNSDGKNGVSTTVKIKKVDAQNKIFKVSETSNATIEFIDKIHTIYPQPDVKCNSFNSYLVQNSGTNLNIVTLNGDTFSINDGGSFTLKTDGLDVNGAVIWTKTSTVFVHRKADSVEIGNVDIIDYKLLTSKDSVSLQAFVQPASASQTLRYGINLNDVATVSELGIVTFLKAGEIIVTIESYYGDVLEASRAVYIESTFNTLRNFDIVIGGSTAQNSYVLQNINDTLQFSVQNLIPIDYSINNLAVAIDNKNIISSSIIGNIVSIKGIGKGLAKATFEYGGLTRAIDFEIKLKSQAIEIKNSNVKVSDSITVLNNTCDFTAQILPLNANDLTVLWSVDKGASIVNGKLTMPANAYGTYIVNVTAGDGASSKQFSVIYVEDITGLKLEYGEITLDTNSNIDLKWNQNQVVLKISVLPLNLANQFDFSKISFYASFGSKVERNGQFITVTLADSTVTPSVNEDVSISYNKFVFNVHISRFGVKSVEFVDHDNAQDTLYGLQQARFFGKISYYDGVGNVAYYRMPVTVSPLECANKLVWTTSDSNVTVSYVNGNAQVNFGNFVGATYGEVEAEQFKFVTVNATDGKGNVFAKYTFNVVQGAVNVLNQAGFLANGQVVLHTNFGGSEEAGYKKYTLFDSTNGNLHKSLIYGNGFIINYNSFNNTYDKKIHKNNLNTSVGRAYNVMLKGGNFSADKSGYHNNFGGSRFEYTYVLQSYKGTWAGEGQVIRNCMFKYMADMSIQVADNTKNVFIENIISIDGGNAALEDQVGIFHLKGFIDVYNFKNAKDLKDLTAISGVIIDSLLRNYKNYITVANNDNYLNSVLFCGKTGGNKRVVKFYDKATNSYVATDDGNADAAPGLKRLVYGTWSFWTYQNTHSYLKYSNQYNSDGSENNAYLANQDKKLLRIQP